VLECSLRLIRRHHFLVSIGVEEFPTFAFAQYSCGFKGILRSCALTGQVRTDSQRLRQVGLGILLRRHHRALLDDLHLCVTESLG
jgi:hypothetical protein